MGTSRALHTANVPIAELKVAQKGMRSKSSLYFMSPLVLKIYSLLQRNGKDFSEKYFLKNLRKGITKILVGFNRTYTD